MEKINREKITVVGAGLAGSEAAWQLACRGYQVTLKEMRPSKLTPAHKTANPAELVCSNSFKSLDPNSASGSLKEELRKLGCLILTSAERARVPAGQALAVDREKFSDLVRVELEKTGRIAFDTEEVRSIPTEDELAANDEYWVIASGPLTSDGLAQAIAKTINTKETLHFYDAIAPILDSESIDFDQCFFGNRYGEEGEGDYLNIPLDKTQYYELIDAINKSEKVPLQSFEDTKYFESCLPIEVMAERGPDTLRFGPLKPVGFIDPKTKRRPYAVIQLRIENQDRTMFSMVGFQTKMKWGEQKRVLSTLPGLEKAEFLRFGSIHRNTYLNSPELLNANLSLKANKRVFLAGQITGVEGYLESTAIGLLAALNIHRRISANQEAPTINLPKTTVLGSLGDYITRGCAGPFAPMNSNWGLLPALQPIDGRRKIPKSDRKKLYAERCARNFGEWFRGSSWIEPIPEANRTVDADSFSGSRLQA